MGRDPKQPACFLDKKHATWLVSLALGCFSLKARVAARFQKGGPISQKLCPPPLLFDKKTYGQRHQPPSMFWWLKKCNLLRLSGHILFLFLNQGGWAVFINAPFPKFFCKNSPYGQREQLGSMFLSKKPCCHGWAIWPQDCILLKKVVGRFYFQFKKPCDRRAKPFTFFLLGLKTCSSGDVSNTTWCSASMCHCFLVQLFNQWPYIAISFTGYLLMLQGGGWGIIPGVLGVLYIQPNTHWQ